MALSSGTSVTPWQTVLDFDSFKVFGGYIKTDGQVDGRPTKVGWIIMSRREAVSNTPIVIFSGPLYAPGTRLPIYETDAILGGSMKIDVNWNTAGLSWSVNNLVA